MSVVQGSVFSVAILLVVIGVFILAFNSGNVSEKTTLKINHTISLSVDAGSNEEDQQTTSPSLLPITRALSDEIPDLPPPGYQGALSRIHGLHSRMATMHFTQDGKPFYLDKTTNRLAVLTLSLNAFTSHGQPQKQRCRTSSETPDETNSSIRHKQMQISRHVKHSQSLPTYSTSSLGDITGTPNGVEIGNELDKIEEERDKLKQKQNGKMNGYEHTPPEDSVANGRPSLSGVEIIMKKSIDK
eukprot:236659_1